MKESLSSELTWSYTVESRREQKRRHAPISQWVEHVEVIGGGDTFQFAHSGSSNASGRVDAVVRGGACSQPTQGHTQMLPPEAATTRLIMLPYPRPVLSLDVAFSVQRR